MEAQAQARARDRGTGVNITGVRWGPLSLGTRDRLLAAARRSPLTYDHEGSTLDPSRRTAPGVRSHHLDVGVGSADFASARAALRTWVPQRGISALIEPQGQPVVPGASVLVVLRCGPFSVVAPDRIVAVIDEPRHFAFAYGTLPGHPERGEESFSVEHRSDDTVWATIRVHAEAATLLARAGAPAVRWLQTAALRRYLAAVADHVRADRASR
ncbi:hypothetical protein BH24ACT2_BH24ACT2_00690 [soil metagenome]